MSTERLFVGQSFTPQLRGINLVPPATPKIVSWSEGTDAEIAAMLDAHYAGTINLHEVWNVGDERIIRLSEIADFDKNSKANYAERDMPFVLVHKGGKYLSNGNECAFVVQTKEVLYTLVANVYSGGPMNPTKTNVGGWKECQRRIWLNDVFKSSLPQSSISIFKRHINKTSKGNQSIEFEETEDLFALPTPYNMFGQIGYAVNGEDNIHWRYYMEDKNRIKKKYGNGKDGEATIQCLRSPVANSSTEFCQAYNYSGYMYNDKIGGDQSGCFAPFGTI